MKVNKTSFKLYTTKHYFTKSIKMLIILKIQNDKINEWSKSVNKLTKSVFFWIMAAVQKAVVIF